MLKIILMVVVFLLAWGGFAHAFLWDSGHHVVGAGDVLGEGIISNSASAEINGGTITQLIGQDTSYIQMSGGFINIFRLQESSSADIKGGTWGTLFVDYPEDGLTINLHVDDYQMNYDSFNGYDHITGTWFGNAGDFDLLISEAATPYVHFVPEPFSLCLISSGLYVLVTVKRK